jgi:hypothetical protein
MTSTSASLFHVSCLAAIGAHRQVKLGALQEGFNKGLALQGKVLQAVSHDNSVPL